MLSEGAVYRLSAAIPIWPIRVACPFEDLPAVGSRRVNGTDQTISMRKRCWLITAKKRPEYRRLRLGGMRCKDDTLVVSGEARAGRGVTGEHIQLYSFRADG